MNNVSLIGRVTKEIELRKTQSGKSVTNFTLAVKRTKDTADFIPCEAWEKNAVFLDTYVKKGNRIGLTGRIQTKTYDTQEGKKFVTAVMCDRIELLESKPQEPQQKTDEFGVIDEIDPDELPF